MAKPRKKAGRLDGTPALQRLLDRVSNSGGLARLLGLKLVSISKRRVKLLLPWSRLITQRDKLVHGGALAALADTAAGLGTLYSLPKDWDALTTHLEIEFFGNIRSGFLEASARLVHRGRKTMAWEVLIRESLRKKLVSISFVSLLLIPPSGPGAPS